MTYTSRTGKISFSKMTGEVLLSTTIDVTSITIGSKIFAVACPLCEDGDGLLRIYKLSNLDKLFEIQGNEDEDEDTEANDNDDREIQVRLAEGIDIFVDEWDIEHVFYTGR